MGVEEGAIEREKEDWPWTLLKAGRTIQESIAAADKQGAALKLCLFMSKDKVIIFPFRGAGELLYYFPSKS